MGPSFDFLKLGGFSEVFRFCPPALTYTLQASGCGECRGECRGGQGQARVGTDRGRPALPAPAPAWLPRCLPASSRAPPPRP